jgi:hypothetical protein
MKIINLPKDEFMNYFFETINIMKEVNNLENKKISYKFRSNTKYFYDLNLENLIFTAKNNYELWLLVYRFLIQHTSVKVINKITFDPDGNLQILNEITDKHIDEHYNIGEYWEIRDIFIQEEKELDMKDIVDLVVNDLFNNKTFWIERCKI